MNRLATLLPIALLVVAINANGQENASVPKQDPLAGVRTWTDTTGKYKTEAEFVEIKDGQVTLKKSDGRILTLPLSRLCEDDQKLIRSAFEKRGPKVGKDGLAIADWSAARPVALKAPVSWKLEPEEPLEPGKPLVDGAVPLGPPVDGSTISEGVITLGFDRKQGHAILARMRQGKVWIERCDLVAGRTLGSFELPPKLRPMDVDPSGQRLVTRSEEFGFGKKGVATIWDIAGFEPTKIVSWEPYAAARSSGRDISFAAFVDAGNVLMYGNGTLSMWNIPTVRAIWATPISRPPRLSAGRKYMVVPAASGMYVMEAASGKILGRLPGDGNISPAFAISDDAQRIAMYASGRLQVWDCKTGERYRDFSVPGAAGNLALDWIDKDHLLVSRSHVVNVERRMTLWRYDGIHTDGVTFGGKYWTVLGGGPNGKCYVPFRMPHDEALKAIDSVPEEDLLVAKPGDKIKLVVKLGFAADQQKKISELLARRLTEAGFVVTDDARLVFEAIAEQGQPATVQYEDIRFPRRTSSVKVNENSYFMRISEGKNVVWQTGGRTDAPPLVLVERGQTIDDALSSFNGLNLAFFEKTNIPKRIARPGKHGGAYGISRVTSEGLVTTHKP